MPKAKNFTPHFRTMVNQTVSAENLHFVFILISIYLLSWEFSEAQQSLIDVTVKHTSHGDWIEDSLMIVGDNIQIEKISGVSIPDKTCNNPNSDRWLLSPTRRRIMLSPTLNPSHEPMINIEPSGSFIQCLKYCHLSIDEFEDSSINRNTHYYNQLIKPIHHSALLTSHKPIAPSLSFVPSSYLFNFNLFPSNRGDIDRIFKLSIFVIAIIAMIKSSTNTMNKRNIILSIILITVDCTIIAHGMSISLIYYFSISFQSCNRR